MKVHKNFFSTREEVMDDLKKTGHWPTTYVSGKSPELPLHWHDLDVSGYVMSGSSYVLDEHGVRFDIEAGDKLEIPRGSLHAEGEVKESVTYIVGTQFPGQFFEQFTMREIDDPKRLNP